MLCEKCKEREAAVVVTEVIGNIRKQHHLCQKCAAESEWGMFLEGELSLGRLLSGILGLQNEAAEKQEKDEYAQIVCPTCGTTYRDFLNDSQFGCSDCYRTFGILMGSTIKRLQGTTSHVGKRPRFQGNGMNQEMMEEVSRQMESPEEKILLLKSRLQEALAEEEYEEAAKLRDVIRALQEGREVDA